MKNTSVFQFRQYFYGDVLLYASDINYTVTRKLRYLTLL